MGLALCHWLIAYEDGMKFVCDEHGIIESACGDGIK